MPSTTSPSSNSTHHYMAFGLTIASELELPYLLPTLTEHADINIKLGTVDKNGLASPDAVKPFTQQAPNEFWLYIPEVAWYYVTSGNSIVIEPEQPLDLASVRLFLLGTCMGVLLHQLKRLVIHGNAIRVGDECVIFAGRSGIGKSTLAGAFYQRGYEILADDLAVIDSQHKVYPSYPRIKFWQDSADKLSIDTAPLAQISPKFEKYHYSLSTGFCTSPLPVKAIYILEQHNHNEFMFEPVSGLQKYPILTTHTYRFEHIEGLGLKGEHLKLCASLANQLSVTKITRPALGFELDKLVTLIEADLKICG